MARTPSLTSAQADIFDSKGDGNVWGVVGFRRNRAGAVQPLETVVHDGDTIQVSLAGSGSLRFLGIDTPEVAIGNSGLTSPRLVAKFSDPAVLDIPGMDPELRAHLAPKIGPDTMENHLRHGKAGQAKLAEMVEADRDALGQTNETFSLYIVFSYEVFDGSGRFLVFVNRNEPDPQGLRPITYNERMLEAGYSEPYYIWPNIDPFRTYATVIDAVPSPNDLKFKANDGKFGRSREFVKAARAAAQLSQSGVFNPQDPLKLAAHELRFLNDKRLPSRAVIDLSNPAKTLLRPQNYWKVEHPEDRFFIPPEFVPAFVAKGWKLEGWL